ncbi:unnamed protein product [Dibothriocephalus latus]|uniref:Mob1/phocein family protein n=1 Tax=Dibothriocephalus latus TaxID=60516 RepID=A0A3P7P0A4_DIBLA|nr:unnamed protein product [Dibothriocephalus latus]
MSPAAEAVRRNRPGTKQEVEYIQQLIRKDFRNVDEILSAPEGQDQGVWKYEHLRQFCMELNGLAIRLQEQCTPDTCAQMTATEQWIFLCAAHKTPKECPAIDYTRHTLDGAACLLNSNKYFPSRVTIKESSIAKLGSVCRRVYRIFSHAYYHHRAIFDEFEVRKSLLRFAGLYIYFISAYRAPQSNLPLDASEKTALCHRFTSFVLKYSLMNKENLLVPIAGSTVEDCSAATAAPPTSGATDVEV